ncbi:MAG TPA: hypothetical protein VD978_21885 [Azospirillum sp.]|nr:hypothetical protein [Azospirillum sp.]
MTMELNDFLNDLNTADDEVEIIDLCRRTVLHGTPVVFHGKEDDFYSFRKRTAERFGVSFYEVYIVGSAKLGFSPYKRKPFDLDSDIDVAIVSNNLFEEILDEIYKYQMELRASRKAVTREEMKMYHEFLEYVAIGWMRPDKLPLSFRVGELKSDWFRFFLSISNGKSEVGNYKVTAGVFKSYRHLELYTLSCLRTLKKSLSLELRHG